MQKQTIIKDDKRYLIYYTFPNEEAVSVPASRSGKAGIPAASKPSPAALPAAPESGTDTTSFPATGQAGT